MPLYETIFITRHELSTNDVEKITSDCSEILKKNGGEIIKTEQWGLRELAYPINKSNKAYYTFIANNSPFKAVDTLNKKMKLNEDIIRFINVKVEKISDGSSAIINKPLSEEVKK